MKIAKVLCLVIAIFAGVVSCKNRNMYRRTSSDSLTRLWIEPKKNGVSGAELFDSLRFVQLETTPGIDVRLCALPEIAEWQILFTRPDGNEVALFRSRREISEKVRSAGGTGPTSISCCVFSRPIRSARKYWSQTTSFARFLFSTNF